MSDDFTTASGADAQTIETYNAMAREYDAETTDFWDRFPRTFLDVFSALSGKRVLDVGSGPGRDALLLAHAGKEVTCLDASEAMVRICRERGLNAVLGDFNELPFPDASFDGVWSYTALLHTKKRCIGTPLREIRRVLVPSRILALGLIEGDTEMYRESSGVGMPRWFSYWQQEEIEAAAAREGFIPEYFEAFQPGSKRYLNFIFRAADAR